MKFVDTVLRSYPTGSRYICYPSPTDTYNDTVILVNGYYDWGQMLVDEGWESCGQYDQGGDFQSFRKGEENYIVTEEEKFFLNYVKATDAARTLNLKKKEDRIALFQAVMDSSDGFIGLVHLNRNKNDPVKIALHDPLRDPPWAVVDIDVEF